MAEPLADQIMRKVKLAAELYNRLMLVIAPAGEGKTAALQDVRDRTGAPLVNVNLELSCRMLDLTERQRALQLPRVLRDLVSKSLWTDIGSSDTGADVWRSGPSRNLLSPARRVLTT